MVPDLKPSRWLLLKIVNPAVFSISEANFTLLGEIMYFNIMHHIYIFFYNKT